MIILKYTSVIVQYFKELLLVGLLFLFSAGITFAQEDHGQSVLPKGGNSKKSTENIFGQNKSVPFQIDARHNGYLHFTEIEKGSMLLCGQKAIHIFNSDQLKLNIDSLKRLYGPKLQLELYNRKGFYQPIVRVVDPQRAVSKTKDVLYLNPSKNFSNFFWTAFIVFFLVVAVFKLKNSTILMNYLKFVNSFSLRNKQEYLLNIRVVNKINVYFIVLLSMLVSIVLTSIFYNSDVVEDLFLKNLSFVELLLFWLTGVGLVVFLFFSKILWVNIISSLMRIEKFRPIHYFNYIRWSFMTYLACMFIWLILVHALGETVATAASFLIPIILILFGLRCLFLCFKILNFGRYRKLYLFSYLCATEIVPYIIIVRFFQ